MHVTTAGWEGHSGARIGLNDGVTTAAAVQVRPLRPRMAAHCRASIAFVAPSDSDCRRPQPRSALSLSEASRQTEVLAIPAGADRMRVTLVDLEVRELGVSGGLELLLELECLYMSHSGKKNI